MNKSQRMRTQRRMSQKMRPPRGVSTQRRMSQRMRPTRPVIQNVNNFGPVRKRKMSQRIRQPRGVFENANNNFEPVRQRRKTFTRKSSQSRGRKTRMTPIQSVNN